MRDVDQSRGQNAWALAVDAHGCGKDVSGRVVRRCHVSRHAEEAFNNARRDSVWFQLALTEGKNSDRGRNVRANTWQILKRAEIPRNVTTVISGQLAREVDETRGPGDETQGPDHLFDLLCARRREQLRFWISRYQRLPDGLDFPRRGALQEHLGKESPERVSGTPPLKLPAFSPAPRREAACKLADSLSGQGCVVPRRTAYKTGGLRFVLNCCHGSVGRHGIASRVEQARRRACAQERPSHPRGGSGGSAFGGLGLASERF